MRILLAAATPFEIKPVLEEWTSARAGETGTVDAQWQPQKHIHLESLITGVGLVSATYHLQKALTADRPDLVIQAGVGGCFDPGHPLGKVVLVADEVIADQGVEEGGVFKDLFELSFLQEDRPPYCRGRLRNPYLEDLVPGSLFLDHFDLTGIPRVRGISVNEITTDPERLAHWKEHYDAGVESMEGAALHFVCLEEKVPFLQIRSLSNYMGERDKDQWKLGLAISNLNEALYRLLSMPKPSL